MSQEKRVEQVFHDQVWGVANASSLVERAVMDGRALAYMVLKLADQDGGEAAFAERWLDEYGRDRLREGVPKDQDDA